MILILLVCLGIKLKLSHVGNNYFSCLIIHFYQSISNLMCFNILSGLGGCPYNVCVSYYGSSTMVTK
jgi:hypothetical protein